MPEVKVDDIFKLSSGKYITLEDTTYDKERYIFVNKLDEHEEPTKEFLVFKCTDKGLLEEKNRKILKVLLNYFSEQANKKLELVNEFYLNKGEKQWK